MPTDMMGSMMAGMGLWGLLWTVTLLAVLAFAVLGGVWLVRQLAGNGQRRAGGLATAAVPPGDAARDRLRLRYAAGEIDDEEYERRLAALDWR